MAETWYAILAFMIAMYVVLDGWNIGAGAIHLLVARNDADRRTVVAAIGPFWVWHEVWLIAAGGVLLLAFPAVMASLFSGFYLAMHLLVWGLIGRGVAIEMAGHIRDRMWRTFWDTIFAISNIVLAILLGAAFGNVVRGVPLDAQGTVSLALFTNFQPTGAVGLLDWYTIAAAVFMLLCLSAHGAAYLAWRTEGSVNAAARRLGGRLWGATFVMFAILAILTWIVRPDMFASMTHRPVAWLCIAMILGGVSAIVTGWQTGRERRAFLGGCIFIIGMAGAGAAGLYPIMLHSTLSPEYSVSLDQGGAFPLSQKLALFWWPVALALSLGYIAFIARYFGGKVGPAGPQSYGTASEPLPDEEPA